MLELILVFLIMFFGGLLCGLFCILGGLWNQSVCAELKELRESVDSVSRELRDIANISAGAAGRTGNRSPARRRVQ